MPLAADVRRIDLGYFVRPAAETGSGMPRVEPVLGYLVRLAHGVLLFDTGMGVGAADLEAHYRPVRRSLPEALACAGTDLEEIVLVVNCHLHFDHCGGNPLLPGRPIIVQERELALARTPDYTLPELIDFPGALFEPIVGEAEIAAGVFIVPTPGHTAGHHSLVVRCADGTVIVAGQAHDFASDYSAEVLALHAARTGLSLPLLPVNPWVARLEQFDPDRVVFAHDHAVWEPSDPLR